MASSLDPCSWVFERLYRDGANQKGENFAEGGS